MSASLHFSLGSTCTCTRLSFRTDDGGPKLRSIYTRAREERGGEGTVRKGRSSRDKGCQGPASKLGLAWLSFRAEWASDSASSPKKAVDRGSSSSPCREQSVSLLARAPGHGRPRHAQQRGARRLARPPQGRPDARRLPRLSVAQPRTGLVCQPAGLQHHGQPTVEGGCLPWRQQCVCEERRGTYKDADPFGDQLHKSGRG